MILALDIGNTSILLGIFDGRKFTGEARFSSGIKRKQAEFKKDIEKVLNSAGIDSGRLEGIIISSVVPSLDPVFKELCSQWFKREPLFVNADVTRGMKISCDNPGEVGADRIAVSLAAKELYGAPLIVVDFGTAVTFDVVGEDGTYRGGVIAPGMEISLKALSEKTALLPSVEIKKPGSIVGRNTVHSMQSGIVYGFIGQVKEIISRIKKEIKGSPGVIATGSYAGVIAEDLAVIDRVHPNLILEGLRIIWEGNQNK